MMKPLYAAFLFMLTLSLFSSCKKDELKSYYKDFSGTWELRKQICWECDPTQITFDSKNGNIIILGTDGSYETKEKNISTFKGTYTLQLKADCGDDKQKVAFLNIKPSEHNNERRVEINDEGLLTICTPHCWADGGCSYYERVE